MMIAHDAMHTPNISVSKSLQLTLMDSESVGEDESCPKWASANDAIDHVCGAEAISIRHGAEGAWVKL